MISSIIYNKHTNGNNYNEFVEQMSTAGRPYNFFGQGYGYTRQRFIHHHQ